MPKAATKENSVEHPRSNGRKPPYRVGPPLTSISISRHLSGW